MLIIVSYDVSTENTEGRKRLRNVSRICLRYGQRVQNSVFECQIDYAQYLLLKNELLKIVDQQHDSIRFYSLGSKYESKVEHYGIKTRPDMAKDTLLL